MTAPFDLVSFANGLLASQRPAIKCGGCSSPATRRDADGVADVCEFCGEASDDQKRDREKRMRRMAEREEI